METSRIPIVSSIPVPSVNPKRDYLLIRVDPTPKTSIIHLAPTAQVKKPYMKVRVMRAGPGLKDTNGVPSGCNCVAGEDVVLMPDPTMMIPVDGGEHLKSMNVEATRYFLVPDSRVIGGFFEEE